MELLLLSRRSGRGRCSRRPSWLLAPGDALLGLAVRCPVCDALSVNLVSQPHVDVPFWNDARVGVVEHVFADDAVPTLEEFRARALLVAVRRAPPRPRLALIR